jgi:hypothetical protein
MRARKRARARNCDSASRSERRDKTHITRDHVERETETEKAEAASISMIRGESRASALVNVGTR